MLSCHKLPVAKFLVADYSRQPYAIVDFIPLSGNKNLASSKNDYYRSSLHRFFKGGHLFPYFQSKDD